MITRIMRRTVAVFAFIVVGLGVGAVAAVASPVRRGAIYDGRGRQPHFSLPNGASYGSFVLRLVVAPNGRRVSRLYVWGLAVACHGGFTNPDIGSAPAVIRRDGTFRARLPVTFSSALTLTGRFLAHGRARGTLRYRGGAPLKGCNADGVWTAHVKPPPPPVQHFVGTTGQGTQVTFERTIERTPHLTRFDFGSLQTNCGPRQVATGTQLGPPFDVQFALAVHQHSFSGDYLDEAFDVKITGSFGADNSASGTVNYGDRGGCNTGDVHWTANPAASASG